MELQLLYDEEREREMPAPWSEDKTSVDMFYLRIRLFKGVGTVSHVVGVEHHPVYLLLQDYTSYEGDPAVNRDAHKRQTKRAFVQGPDSKLIRKAVAIADGFGGKRAYDSR